MPAKAGIHAFRPRNVPCWRQLSGQTVEPHPQPAIFVTILTKTIANPPFFRPHPNPKSRLQRLWESSIMQKKTVTFVLLAAILALSGCVCRPGHIGPYGGVHPGACYADRTTATSV
jgi:hypothetical protein